MFRERLDQTPFTTEEAGYTFPNISAESEYAGDKSFLATARAMLAKRIPEGQALTIVYMPFNISKNDVEQFEEKDLAYRILGGVEARMETLTVIELTNNDTVDRCMGAIRAWASEGGNAWESVDRVEALFRKSFPVNGYINRETRSAILLVDRLSLRKWHSIQVVLFRCLPWFFPEENPLTEEEKTLVRSLSKDTPTEYLDILRREAAKYDFEQARVRRLLDGFESTYERRRIENCKNEIERKRRQIKDYNDSIASLLADMRNLNVTLLGSIASMEQRNGSSELMDYFLADRNLSIESADNGVLKFFVKGYLDTFNPDEAEACIDNPNSFVNERRSDSRISKEEMKRLMRAVFLDQTIRIRVCAAYTFEIGDGIFVRGQSNKRFPAEYSTYLPNPHIQAYSCMGGYTKLVNDLLIAGDYVGAIAQCEASAGSLNWGDWTVMRNFMDRMYTDNQQYFELPDGSCVNQKEAVKWLDGQEEQR